MVGQPVSGWFGDTRGSASAHPFAKSAKWWGSQFRGGSVINVVGSANTHPFAKSAKWWGSHSWWFGHKRRRSPLVPTLSQRTRNGGAASRGWFGMTRGSAYTHPFAKSAKWWGSQSWLVRHDASGPHVPPFRKEREMVGQPAYGAGSLRVEVAGYPPFRKEREMVGQPVGAGSLRASPEIPTLSQKARNGGAAYTWLVRMRAGPDVPTLSQRTRNGGAASSWSFSY